MFDRFSHLVPGSVVLAATLIAAPAMARQADPAAVPEVLSRVTACRDVTDSTARLACYDTAVAALDSAQREGAVVVADRAQINAARRQLFGFDIASMPTMFGRGDASESLDEIQAALASAREAAPDRWVFTLDDGTVWRQLEPMRLDFRNRAGEPVEIKRGMLGSYRLTVGRSRAINVRRQ